MEDDTTFKAVERRPIRRVAQALPVIDDATYARAREEVQSRLVTALPFSGRIEIHLDDTHGFIVDAERRAIEECGGPVDARCYIHPDNLTRVIKGDLDPRTAILFGQIDLQDGQLRPIVAFCDALSGRKVVQKLDGGRELPKPTDDWKRIRQDFEEFGYALVKDAIEPSKLQALRTRVLEQAEGEIKAGVAWGNESTQSVWTLLNKGKPFHDLLLEPIVENFIPKVIGEYPLLSFYVVQIAKPNNVAMMMHLDQTFVQPDVRDFPMGVNILWFLDDISEANGGTRIMPGSHKGTLAPADPYDLEGTIAAAGPAGTALLLDSRVWHAAGRNTTDKNRHVIAAFFVRSYLRTQENYFLSLLPEVEETLDPRIRVMIGQRCTGSLGGVQGPVEGNMAKRPDYIIGPLS